MDVRLVVLDIGDILLLNVVLYIIMFVIMGSGMFMVVLIFISIIFIVFIVFYDVFVVIDIIVYKINFIVRKILGFS